MSYTNQVHTHSRGQCFFDITFSALWQARVKLAYIQKLLQVFWSLTYSLGEEEVREEDCFSSVLKFQHPCISVFMGYFTKLWETHCHLLAK